MAVAMRNEAKQKMPGEGVEAVPNNVNIVDAGVAPDIEDEEKDYTESGYFSRKVFIGGIPPSVETEVISERFAEFGHNIVEFPHRKCCNLSSPPSGFAFVVYENESAVHRLINTCTAKDKKMLVALKYGPHNTKEVQIKPWVRKDLEYKSEQEYAAPHGDRYSIVIKGFPGGTKASTLALLVRRNIGEAVRVTILSEPDTHYPKRAAQVVFPGRALYAAGIQMRQMTMSSRRGTKILTISPYNHNSMQCEICGLDPGNNFCAEISCLLYMCNHCYHKPHGGHPAPNGYRGNHIRDGDRRRPLYPCNCHPSRARMSAKRLQNEGGTHQHDPTSHSNSGFLS